MKRFTALLLALLMTLTLAACGGEKNPAADTDTDIDKNGGRTFTLAIDSDIDDFNPMSNQMTNYVCLMVFNVYEPLFYLNEDMAYTMALATDVQQPDELTYEITLREGVTFHNGQPFTAQDVVNTIDYIRNEANGAWRAPQYGAVDSMTVSDDYHLTIHLTTPTPAFMDSLAYTPIFCKDDDPAALTATANGTGAFRFVSWTPNDQIVFEKFAGYWDADAVSIEKLIVKPSPDYTVAITNMEAGALDMINRVTAENAAAIESKNGLKLLSAKSSNTMDEFEIGRHHCQPLSDPKVMEAMLLAFDIKTVNETVYHGKGTVMTSCYPAGAKYHKDVLRNEYDLEKAKAVLAETDYPDGFSFSVKILKGYDAGEMAAVIWQASLAKIGITMNIETEEMSVWLENYLSRNYDMIWNTYGMVGSDPATFNSIILEQLYPYQLSDLPELQELIATGKATGDETIRQETYAKIQDLVAEYCPVYPYIAAPLICGMQAYVEGVEINAMGHLILKNVTVG